MFYYVFSEHVFIFPILFTCSSLYHQDSFAVCIAIVFHRDLEPFQTRLSYGIAPFETHRPQISCSQCFSTGAASFDSLSEVSGQGQTYWNVLWDETNCQLTLLEETGYERQQKSNKNTRVLQFVLEVHNPLFSVGKLRRNELMGRSQ